MAFSKSVGHGVHVLLDGRNQLQPLLGEGFGQPAGDIPFVGVELAEQALAQLRHRLTVINIARRQFDAEQFAFRINNAISGTT